MIGEIKKNRWKQIVNFTVIGFLVVEVVLLMLQNRELKTQFNTMIKGQFNTDTLNVGERVENFEMMRMNNTPLGITYLDSTKKYLFFVFSTTCPYCEKNLEHWKYLEGDNHDESLRIIWLSIHDLDKTREYVGKKNLNFDIAVADTSFSRKYKIGGVPKTILIKGNGTVEKVWTGVLDAEKMKEIQTLTGA